MPDDVDETAHPVIPAESAVHEAPATGVPLTGISLPADGVVREVTLDAALPDGGWANLQHELAATRDAYTSLKQAYDALVIEHNAALDKLAALPA